MIANLYLVGAPKAGTTSLSQWLHAHPDVFFPRPKEPLYWSSDYPLLRRHRGFEDRSAYEGLYSSPEAARATYRADGSTTYLYSRAAARSILAEVPEARFLVAIRNPVDLLASWHRTSLMALNENEPDLAKAWRRSLAGRSPDNPDLLDPQRVDYPMMGRLGEAVQRLLEVVPRDQVHVIRFEDLAGTPERVWTELTGFLNLASEPMPEFRTYNASNKAPRSELLHRLKHRPPRLLAGPVNRLRAYSISTRSTRWAAVRHLLWRAEEKPTMSPALRAEMTRYFADDVALLGSLVGMDLSSWSQPGTAPKAA